MIVNVRDSNSNIYLPPTEVSSSRYEEQAKVCHNISLDVINSDKSGPSPSVAEKPVNLEINSLEIGLSVDDQAVSEALEDFVNYCIMSSNPDISEEDRKQKIKETFNFLLDEQRAADGLKPRIEIRPISAENKELISNIALVFPNTEKRNEAYDHFVSSHPQLSIVSAGSTTLEIGNRGVNKATIIHFVANHLEEIAQQSGYKKGPVIDALQNRSFLCLDADGTLWEKPQTNQSPEANNLSNSITREEVLDYLKLGGILVINSGNDPQRTARRLLEGIPEHLRKELLSRIFIGSGGGHSLVTLSPEGEAEVVLDYQKKGLSELKEPQKPADFIYLGDDYQISGNDYAGFMKAGEQQSVVVSKSGKVQGFAEEVHVHGETHAVRDVIGQINSKAQLHPNAPLFSDVPSIRSSSRYMPGANALVADTLNVLGRQGVNELLSYCEHQVNAPVKYEREKIDTLIQSFNDLRQKYTLKDTEVSKSLVKLDFKGLEDLSEELNQSLLAKGRNPTDYELFDNWMTQSSATFEAKIEQALDEMNLQEGDIVRLLEPGNNDQSTPIVVAQQAKQILEYAKKNNLNLNVQVLVMGKGGHATTQLFPQFAELKGREFSGTPEAESLGESLKNALAEENISVEYDVAQFDEKPGDRVQIKLARESTNTGENVDEAGAAYLQGNIKPAHVFVCSATGSSTRQAQTFAQQYSPNRANPLAEKRYETITAIPPTKSDDFIRYALNDHQAVTELYAQLAEVARLFAYSYNVDNPYIPASPLNKEHLEKLYQVYDLLSQTNDLEASKEKTVQEILVFFQSRFQTMEGAITWSKDRKLQTLATKQAIQQLNNLYQKKIALEKAHRIYRARVGKFLDKKAVAVYDELFEKSRSDSSSDREKLVYLTLMSKMFKMLEVFNKHA